MRFGRRSPLLFVALCCACISWVGEAGAGEDHREARRLRETGQILPLERIVEQAQAVHPGKLLDIELDREDGRYIYELELVDEQGVVWELTLDAATGALLKRELED